MAGGYVGKILYVDLTNGKTWQEALPDDWRRDFVGGVGINLRLAYDLIKPGTDPLAPENYFIVGAGPLVGSGVMSAAKTAATSKGPQTGTIISSPAGHFGPALKRAGFDHLVVGGRAEHPVYLRVEDGRAEIGDARHLWGRDLFETTDALRPLVREGAVAAIGPAGEHLVAFAMAMVNKQATWNRGGFGAVLGSKNLKAIVVGGTGTVGVADRTTLQALNKECLAALDAAPVRDQWRQLGPLIAWDSWIKMGKFLIRNFDDVYPAAEATARYGPQAFVAEAWKKALACPSCALGCKAIVEVRGGPQAGLQTVAPSIIGAVEALGPRCGLASYAQIVEGVDRCNRLGLDMITFSGLMEYLIDLYERRIVGRAECGDFVPQPGAAETFHLLELVAYRRGVGDILAGGWRRVIAELGREAAAEAVQIKGMDPSFDLRPYLSTESLGTLTNLRGGHPMEALSATVVPGRSLASLQKFAARIGVPATAAGRVFPDETGYSAPRLLKWVEDYNTLLLALGLCNREPLARIFDVYRCAALYAAATGEQRSPEELVAAGERAWCLGRAFNAREGFTRQDDMPPQKWLTKPLNLYGEPAAPLTEAQAAALLDAYYDERGWDVRTGNPLS